SGRVLVAFERNQRIGTFLIRKGVLGEPISYLRPPMRLPANKGLESVAVLLGGRYKGAVIAFAERAKDGKGHHRGWLWRRGRPSPLSLTDDGGFDITDLASLPNGALIVLERRFRWSEGVQFRLRLVPAKRVLVGSVLSGITLVKADMRYDIDNMEGLALHRGPQGQTVITLISDDNFNRFLQKTILLQFVLPPEVLAAK
ncbi:MAG: esterase-like activity of phytase family protein, partial [Hyphomicrobiaceae bacterium]|nr:esterase-like activity of phytase family protein [Hyphomicrobiaceae bacterium]